VAPSHATPMGGALPVGRRLALLDWAARYHVGDLDELAVVTPSLEDAYLHHVERTDGDPAR